MELPIDLITQFAKVAQPKTEKKTETTVYGTTVELNGVIYVKLDGSELLTPVTTTADVHADERVTVMIKNHTATITGNITSPSARSADVQTAILTSEEAAKKITEFEIAIGNKVDVESLNAESARIDTLVSENATIKQSLATAEADIDTLQADNVTIKEQLIANDASIDNLETTKLDASIAEVTYATIDNLEATNTTVYNLEGTYSDFAKSTTDELTAINAEIDNLQAGILDVESLKADFAMIDFANIDMAAVENFLSKSGIIENLIVDGAEVTGTLIGVTIRGDSIEANTVVADKLVVLGEDGLYYKLNTDGVTTEAEQTEYNSLNGQVITAKSITAEKVNVSDLVAFDATIGGFSITENSIFSEVKDSDDNTTRGIYMDTDGQVNFGDATNYIKYYRDDDGNYRLAISADTILYDINGSQHSLTDLGLIGEYIKIGTYEDEPCIELGETDSEFKVFITNTKILFMEGSGALAYFSNQSLYIKKAVVEEELQQGGFVWKIRDNGNLGLTWVGGDE